MAEKVKIKVWDFGTRVFHWSLVILFFVAYFSGDDENRLHVYAGYGVLALVAYRIVWDSLGRSTPGSPILSLARWKP